MVDKDEDKSLVGGVDIIKDSITGTDVEDVNTPVSLPIEDTLGEADVDDVKGPEEGEAIVPAIDGSEAFAKDDLLSNDSVDDKESTPDPVISLVEESTSTDKPAVSTGDEDTGVSTDVDNEEAESSEDKDADVQDGAVTLSQFFSGKRLIAIIVIFAVAILAPALWVYKFQYVFERKPLSSVNESTPIVMYDHTWDKTRLDSEAVDGLKVNTTQYIMHYKDSSKSCFTFKAKGKDPKHTLKISLSIGEEKSRDLLNAQASAFAYGMRKGTLAVQVCPLLNNDEYSALATEALSEVDWNNPENTWSALIKLSVVDTASFTSTNARIKSILNTVGTISDVAKKTSIQEASLKNGSFMQNARKVSNENTAEAIPALWMDGRNITNGSAFRLYDYKSFYDYLNTLN